MTATIDQSVASIWSALATSRKRSGDTAGARAAQCSVAAIRARQEVEAKVAYAVTGTPETRTSIKGIYAKLGRQAKAAGNPEQAKQYAESSRIMTVSNVVATKTSYPDGTHRPEYRFNVEWPKACARWDAEYTAKVVAKRQAAYEAECAA